MNSCPTTCARVRPASVESTQEAVPEARGVGRGVGRRVGSAVAVEVGLGTVACDAVAIGLGGTVCGRLVLGWTVEAQPASRRARITRSAGRRVNRRVTDRSTALLILL
jgi:hypothetical protein